MATESESSLPPPTSSCPPSTLEIAARAGMLVKLYVYDGYNHATDIPVKNLLQVNSSKESLSNQASYSNLRHCALSQLFKYKADGTIPNYAWRNFGTQFTYFQEVEVTFSDSPLTKKFYIRNGDDLTRALETASTNQLLDDNDNIILHIHCDFINEFQFKEGEKFRKEATAAADNVVKTLKEWIKKASVFVTNHANKLTPHDFVVVSTDNIHHEQLQQLQQQHGKNTPRSSEERKNMDEFTPVEWAVRFIDTFLSSKSGSEKLRKSEDLSSWTTIPKQNTSDIDIYVMMHEYEETIENIADTVVTGFHNASKFLLDLVENFDTSKEVMAEEEAMDKKNQSSKDDVLSIPSNSSLAECSSCSSACTILRRGSSSEQEEELVQEEGVEIVFDSSPKDGEGRKDASSEEWKIFFAKGGEDVVDDHDVVLINHICNTEVVSVSSSKEEEREESDDDMLSFEEVSNSKDWESDNESWAMFSDDE